MSKVLVIGCGAVASVAIQKIAQNSQVFSEMIIASRRIEKCEQFALNLNSNSIKVSAEQVDAEDVEAMILLITKHRPDIVVNVALPYQNIPIMEACIATKTHYLDTACAEVREKAGFEYGTQWVYHQRFKEAGVMALLGSGFDPGVTSVFSMYALKHHFDSIETIDILDANGGDHGYPFATNFNPEINIREVTLPGRYYENGQWVTIAALSHKKQYILDQIGPKDMYLMYHEEIESLAKFVPGVKRIRFYMSFGQSYLNHLHVLENIGMTSVKPIEFEGKEIIPLQFLRAILPDPASLGPRTKGKTNIGVIIKGKKDGVDKHYYVYNVCDHQAAFKETGSQAIAYTTGVPAMIGASLIVQGIWKGQGVYNIEQFDPDPFMTMLNEWGLPWQENFNPVLIDDNEN
ncbi:MAG: saccharopine dehydrogenase family protein [Bacilli bacterium]